MERLKRLRIGMWIWSILSIALVGLQCFAAYYYAYDIPQAVSRISVAVSIYDTGKFQSGDPLIVLIGYISRLTGVHPMTMIYSVLPFVLIPLYYIISFVCLRRLWKNNIVYALCGVCVLSVLSIVGWQSEAAVGCSLLFGYFCTESFLLYALLPFAAYLLIGYCQKNAIFVSDEDENAGDLSECSDEEEEWDMNKHKIINVRNLAIAVVVLVLVWIASTIVMNNKINSLYNVTVQLQQQVNELTQEQ